MSLFVDGEAVTSPHGVLSVFRESEQKGICIGNSVEDGDQPFPGEIDEVKVWRLDPNRIRKQFLDRPVDKATADCWARHVQSLHDAFRRHPDCAKKLTAAIRDAMDRWLRAVVSGPGNARAFRRRAGGDCGSLARGQDRQPEMRKLLADWCAWLRLVGIDPCGDDEFQAFKRSECWKLIQRELKGLDCDPQVPALMRLFVEGCGCSSEPSRATKPAYTGVSKADGSFDLNDLIRAFEPILYFAPGERFYPSDCKRYLEETDELWSAVAPFDDRNSWHTSSPGASTEPIVHSNKISGRSDEPGTFLGESQGGAFPFLFATGSDEGFLEVSGWIDRQKRRAGSDNRFAFLEQLNSLYNLPSSPADPLLHDSRFWYHAEAFDASRLRLLMASQDAPADFKALFPTLLAPPEDGAPLLLCYYLFFPGTTNRSRTVQAPPKQPCSAAMPANGRASRFSSNAARPESTSSPANRWEMTCAFPSQSG